MNYRRLLIIPLMVLAHHSIYGQVERNSLIGEYEARRTTRTVTSTDTVAIQDDSIPIIRLTAVEVNNFTSRILILKRCKKIRIIDPSPITDWGLNTDNPIIFGTFKIVGDSIIIKAKYSIQHFNKLSPKRRVKTKLEKTYTFAIISQNEIMISTNYSWIKILPTKNTPP